METVQTHPELQVLEPDLKVMKVLNVDVTPSIDVGDDFLKLGSEVLVISRVKQSDVQLT